MKALTSKQMAKVDDDMINHYGISLVQMMENAGLGLAMMASKVINHNKNSKIVVLVGKGNNGGDGLVCARHLHNFGYNVCVVLSNTLSRDVPLKQLQILRKIKVPINNYNNSIKNNTIKKSKNNNKIIKIINDSNLNVDTLLGYNARGNPYGTIKELIKLANKSKGKILAVDLPSGLDPDTGKIYDPCIKADYTLTLSYPKKGLLKARKYTGKIYLSYLTIPKELSRKLKFKVYDFSQDLFVRL